MENLIIIGGGPAGIAAALYAARAGLDPIVIHNGPGALGKAEKIENYYGTGGAISGKELYESGIAQARALGVRILEEQVTGVSGFDTFEVTTEKGRMESRALILATGSSRKAPAIEGLKHYEGRGVSYCAICDAFFYRGRKTAVLGNGLFALHEANELAPMAGSVVLLTNGLKDETGKDHAFTVYTQKIAAVEGGDLVTGIRFEDGTTLETDGLFVALGTAGSGSIARQMGAELDEKGNIRVDEQMQSTIPGLFAAGDCTGGLLQVSTAVYEGTKAGLSAIAYIRSL